MPDAGAGGPERWIQEIALAHGRRLQVYVRRILRDPERARDVVQEALLALWRQGRDAVGPKPLAWLYRVCRNRALDVLDKERRMGPIAELGAERELGTAPSPDELVAAAEGRHRVLAALRQLSRAQQEVLRLRFQGGLSYREIAEVVGCSVGNVGFVIHQGVKTLRALLSAEEKEVTRR